MYYGPSSSTGGLSVMGITPSLDETSFYVYGAHGKQNYVGSVGVNFFSRYLTSYNSLIEA
jgi:hypothetical protein